MNIKLAEPNLTKGFMTCIGQMASDRIAPTCRRMRSLVAAVGLSLGLGACGPGGVTDLLVKLITARFVPASTSLVAGGAIDVQLEVSCDRDGLNTPFGRLEVRIKFDPDRALSAGVTATVSEPVNPDGFYYYKCITSTADLNVFVALIPVHVTASAGVAPGLIELVTYLEIEPLITGEPSKDSTLAKLPITVTSAAATDVGLTVAVVGIGRVVSTPAGIDCTGPRTCNARFATGQTVALASTPGSGHVFSAYGGDTDCLDGALTLARTTNCSATFTPTTTGAWLQDGTALNVTASTTQAIVQTPEIELDGEGLPIAAFVENEVVVVRRLQGTTWGTLGTPRGNQVSSSSLAIDSSGAPVVAWEELDATQSNGTRNVYAARWDGATWVTLGSGPVDLLATADAFAPSIRARSADVVLAWAETSSSGGSRIVVRRWSSGAWSDVGTTQGPAHPSTFPESDVPRLAVGAGDQLAVAWSENFLSVRAAELIGGVWTTTASPPFSAATSGAGFFLDLAISSSDGLLLVAQQNNGGNFTVRRWRGGTWSDLGTARGNDVSGGSRIFGLAFSRGRTGAAPLLAYSRRNSAGSIDEFVVERFGVSDWARVGNVVPTLDRHGRPGFEFGVAVVDGPIPRLATEVMSSLVGSSTRDESIVVYRFQ